MWSYFFIILIFITQIKSKRIFPNGYPNGIAGEFARGFPMGGNIPNGIPVNNQLLNGPIANVIPGYMNSAHIYNNVINTNIPNTNIVTNVDIPEVKPEAAYGNQMITTNNNDLSKSIATQYLSNSNLVPRADVFPILKNSDDRTVKTTSKNDIINKIANGWKPKTITLNIGDPYAMAKGKNDNSKFFLEIMVDSVDIHGTVSVAGSMPLYGTVKMNGNVPSTGKASVDFSNGSTKQPVTL